MYIPWGTFSYRVSASRATLLIDAKISHWAQEHFSCTLPNCSEVNGPRDGAPKLPPKWLQVCEGGFVRHGCPTPNVSRRRRLLLLVLLLLLLRLFPLLLVLCSFVSWWFSFVRCLSLQQSPLCSLLCFMFSCYQNTMRHFDWRNQETAVYQMRPSCRRLPLRPLPMALPALAAVYRTSAQQLPAVAHKIRWAAAFPFAHTHTHLQMKDSAKRRVASRHKVTVTVTAAANG